MAQKLTAQISGAIIIHGKSAVWLVDPSLGATGSEKNREKVNIKTIWNPFPGVYVILRTFLCNAHVTMAKQGQKRSKNGQTHACTILNASKPD